MTRTKATAWLVHLYTASGAILGMFALIFAAHHETRSAFFLLIFAMIIDATDGLLARRVKVWEVLPNFDGAAMDNIIDVLTYVWVPVFIMIFEQLLPHPLWNIIPIMAAMYAYGQINMKTEDSFFLGFPSYWNVVALYMFWLQPQALIAVLMIVLPSIATFIPTRYLYPSKNQILWKTSWGLGMIWFWMIIYILSKEEPSQSLVLLSLYYPIYYLAASFYVDWRIRRGEIRAR